MIIAPHNHAYMFETDLVTCLDVNIFASTWLGLPFKYFDGRISRTTHIIARHLLWDQIQLKSEKLANF